MPGQPRRAVILAFLGSFAVYLIPLLHVHGGTLFGVMLFANLSEGTGRKDPLWIAAEVAVAVLYQAIAFASLYWFFSHRGVWRGLTVAGASAGSVVLLYWIMFLALPGAFLIEDDVAPQRTDWEVACTIEDAGLAAIDGGPGNAFANARETWLRMAQGLEYRRLTMPGCTSESIPTPFLTARAGLNAVAPGGALIFSRYGDESNPYSYWYVPGVGREPVALTAPADGDHAPVLSRDGRVVAWLSRLRASNRVVTENRVRLQDMVSGAVRSITLDTPQRLRIQLFDVDVTTGTLVATRNGESLWGFGFDGAVKWGPVAVDGFRLLGPQTLRLDPRGLVVWDGYREEGRYRIRWQFGNTRGEHEVPKGRGITDVALSPDTHQIAVSVTTNLNIGSLADSVFVIDTASGRELYRRYQPTYTRSQLAYLGKDHLAISRFENGRAWVEVLRVPGHVAASR